MSANRSIHFQTRFMKQILPALLLNLLILTVLSACRQNSSEQPSDEKTVIEDTSEEDQPVGTEIIGISDDHGYDFDGKKGYEYLQVNIKVNAEEEGSYLIYTSLVDADGNTISLGNLRAGAGISHASISHHANLSVGENIVPVYFSGDEIRRMKADGPYRLKAVLSDKDAQVIDEAEFMTSEYRHKDFSLW